MWTYRTNKRHRESNSQPLDQNFDFICWFMCWELMFLFPNAETKYPKMSFLLTVLFIQCYAERILHIFCRQFSDAACIHQMNSEPFLLRLHASKCDYTIVVFNTLWLIGETLFIRLEIRLHICNGMASTVFIPSKQTKEKWRRESI